MNLVNFILYLKKKKKYNQIPIKVQHFSPLPFTPKGGSQNEVCKIKRHRLEAIGDIYPVLAF